jgi:hypothetical protein
MMPPADEKVLGKQLTGYAASHCRQCAMGWTRTGKEGGALTICLLDREKVLDNMVDCDRYELRSKV